MSKVERFEELRVWQEARTLANTLYEITRQLTDFPFRDQLRSAAISIMNNIAEGFERRTDADFARFLDIAKGSSGEIRSMLYLGEDQGYVPADRAAHLRASAEQLSAGIATFAKYLRR
jgi:four helix bundle protein